jgi:uncharacterized protein
MAKESALATRRLELAKKGYDLPKLDKDIDPALRIPRSSRLDNWENLTTGFGSTSTHATNNTQFTALGKIDSYQQEQMYRSDWVTRKGIDAPAEDMTRNGISYQHNDDDEDQDKNNTAQKKVEDFDDLLVETFDIWQTAFQAVALARASGGSLTLFNFDDIQTTEEFEEPLNENQVSEIRWVKTVPAWFAIPLTWYRDVNHPKWTQPEHYQVIIREPGFGITLRVHESRMIRMNGRFTTQTPRTLNRGWNDSEIQSVYTALRDHGVCVTEATSTLESFTRDYLGMKGLAEKVMNNETDVILDRVFLSHLKANSSNLAIYDAESEKMEREGTPITGLADLWDRFSEMICGAWSIPRSRFFSSESGALGGNAAESDTRNYFNMVRSKQELQLRPYLNSFMSFVNMAEGMLAELPSYTFNELHEQSDKEKAETRLAVAQTDQIYLDSNVVSAEEVAVSRFSKDTMDLETMNLDFEAREELADEEFSQEDAEAMAGELEGIKVENAINEVAAQQNVEKPEEKKDSQPIILEVKPEIKVEAPIVNVKVPEQKDNSGLIAEIKQNFDDISKKLDRDVEIEI